MATNKEQTPESSGFTVYVKLEPYLAQWLIFSNGGNLPIVFPKNSAENDIIEIGLAPKPNNALPNEPDEGYVPIALPYFKYKDVRKNNYLPKHSRCALKRCIRSRFVVELWTDLFKFGYIGKRNQDLIWAWMEGHGIEATETNWNSVAKIYARKRKTYNIRIWRERKKKLKIRDILNRK